MTRPGAADLRDYTDLRRLPTGEMAGLQQMLFTVGLIVGIGEAGYRHRYCYPTHADAKAALDAWDGTGDPSGRWIKQKGAGIERRNPALGGIPIVSMSDP